MFLLAHNLECCKITDLHVYHQFLSFFALSFTSVIVARMFFETRFSDGFPFVSNLCNAKFNANFSISILDTFSLKCASEQINPTAHRELKFLTNLYSSLLVTLRIFEMAFENCS